MWKPPERIKHALPERAGRRRRRPRAARWFSPVRDRPARAARSAPGCRRWCRGARPTDGLVTPDVIDWYGRFADGPPGVHRRRGDRHPRRAVGAAPAHRPRPLRRPGCARLVDAVRAALATARRCCFIQIIDFLAHPPAPRRARSTSRASSLLGETPPRGAGAHARRRRAGCTRARGRGARASSPRSTTPSWPRCSTRASSSRSSAATASASPTCTCRTSASCRGCCPGCSPTPPSARCAAGFDGVELHYAHAYTMASFLSALNTRDDGYGGPREHRVRLPLEVIAAVRAARRPRRVRRLPLPRRRGHRGRQPRRRRGLVRRRVRPRRARLPLALQGRQVRGRQAAQGRRGRLSVHRAERLRVHADHHLRRARARSAATCRSPPRSARAVRAAGLRRRRSSPPAASASFEQAEEILARGEADIVAAARQTLADPDWFLKMRAGPRRRGPPLRVHELLRGARPAAQAGDVQAVGSRGARRARRQARPDRPAPPGGPRWTR